jgi:steroid delta-isomerase
MTTEFSFGKLMRHLTSGTELPRPAGLPTEEHMRKAVQGYIDNLNNPDPDYVAKYLALPHTVEDPVGAKPMNVSSWDDVQDQMKDLIDVPFIPKRAELTAPISFSLGNKAAMAFTLWAEVDGRDISIDIIEVMTFDTSGKICDRLAYWGVENVTVLD